MLSSTLSHWAQQVVRSARGAWPRRQGASAANRRRLARLRLDGLEDRCLLSTFLVSNTNDAGPGSLRQAILDANFTIGRNTIAFAIPGDGVHTIQLSQSLPDLYNPVIIDGTTQPGYAGHPLIDLSGAEAGSAAAGLTLRYGNNTVKGLIIEGFSSYGIWLRFGNNNVVTGNYIGTDASGTAASPNLIGVEVDQSGDNTIGGAAAADHNLISGNQSYGIDGGGANNLITGNYIGTDLTGTVALPNSTGVRLSGFDNTVGGMESGAGNLVSGNTGVGVQLDGYNSRVAGNLIGTDAAGTAALGNGLVGMRIEGAYNTIGGLTAPARNLISGNMYGSIELGFGFFNLIQGNYIGTDVSGTTTLPDGSFGHGVLVNGDANTIGGKVAGAGNLIAGHSADGIGVGGIDNCVQGNFVGTDVTGTRALGNGVGIRLDDGLNNTIGGTSPGAGNLISGNHTGLVLGVYNRSGNVIQGNDIGTDVSGTAPLGNEYYGVDVEGPTFGMPSSTIGGEAAGAGNIIAFNGLAGLLVELDATGITIEGNAIFANGNLGIELRNGNHNQASPRCSPPPRMVRPPRSWEPCSVRQTLPSHSNSSPTTRPTVTRARASSAPSQSPPMPTVRRASRPSSTSPWTSVNSSRRPPRTPAATPPSSRSARRSPDRMPEAIPSPRRRWPLRSISPSKPCRIRPKGI